ncbi:MAG: hypothetical protein KDM64_08475, partial [Verrucomicrobiae bacterium]|nr:hypothetical protein [Verrucomicrobiae bacterium]
MPDPNSNPLSENTRHRGRGWWLPWIIAALSFAVLLPLYHRVATRRAEKFNSDTTLLDHFSGDIPTHVIFHHDQHAYLNLGRLLRVDGYDYIIPRHRMPGYPMLLSLLYRDADAYQPTPGKEDPRKISDAFFQRAKTFNIWLSMGCIAAIFLFLACYLPVMESLLAAWSIGWLLFVFKACFVQPEVLFDTLALFVVVLMWRQIARPTWRNGLIAGVALAATYFIKSALLPLIALYVVCQAVSISWRALLSIREGGGGAWRRFCVETAQAALIPVLWLILLSPYLYQT